MRDIFGLSFSDSALHISRFSERDDSNDTILVDSIKYPFHYDAGSFFSDENLNLIALKLSDYKIKNQIHDFKLHISLPINFAYIKRIAVPFTEEENILQSQINWELSHYLPGQLSDYKIIKAETEYNLDSYKEVVMICILSSLLERIKQLSVRIKASLQKITVDNFSLENYLKSYRLLDSAINQIVFKIDRSNITTHLFLTGNHYLYFLDKFNDLEAKNSQQDKVIEITKDRYNQIMNILNQLPLPNREKVELFAYGDGFNEKMFRLLSDNFSEKVLSLPRMAEIPGKDCAHGHIEAIGVILS